MEINVARLGHITHMLNELNKAGSSLYVMLELANKFPKVEPVLDDIQEIIDLIYELDVKLNVLKEVEGDLDKYCKVRREYELNLWRQMMENLKNDN